uniref:Structural maintenance of chromosomes protein n=1 Tax=Kwoniella bestiolae CBS 10118 TaxID=1296100 RepID=A0A1B9FQZ7_9TREE|nr:cohesin complex subunit psm1 [Kwoniella bestiolae CBS 10118]OCF21196.1 cohesin complex subunit psm1 [Kwoniella bestiolae CBS 10118]
MPLKRLELSNFKSYRGQQVISFGDAPFTCIIGPNGAGKSNLMDAISFVLGVKSAQLRSTQLKDLVYRGRKAAQIDDEEMDIDEETQQTQLGSDTDARTAWVMVVYEDEKGKEWSFRRSISAGGASSYFLNGRSVAWKEYNGQLEKFNVLVKAKNFLVFQGDVEGVASQDSKALARLIDRISGSLDLAPAYEAAKAAQDKATEASTANYAKKRSIITEVKHFKEQKEEILQWEKLRDAKDALVQRYALWKLYHLTNEINESTQKVEEASNKLAELRQSAERDERKLRDAKKEQAQAQLAVKKGEASVKKAEKAYEDKKPELLALETQIAHSEKKVRNANLLAERVQKDEQRQAESLTILEQGAADVQQRMTEAGERQRQRSQAAGITLSGADLEEYRRLRASANLQAVAERQQLETLRRQQKTLRDGLLSVEDRVQQAQRLRTKLTSEVDALVDREETMSERVDEMKNERETIKGKLDHAQAERQRINMRETEINERLQETYTKLLQAGVDKRESEREAKLKDTIASLKRVFPGVHGRVIDLCRPVASKYDVAVTTVLGRNLDAVVVEHEKVAIDCIEYMRNQRAGQATFIPLDTIQVKPVPERLRNFVKGARLAIDCIEYSPNVERAMQHACGSALICDTMDIAKYVCYDKGQEVKAVTLDGTVIHRSGLITGGQSSSGTRKFDDRQVEGLNKQKELYLSQLQELYRSKPKDKADEGLLESLARLDAELTVAKDDLTAIRTRLNGLREELEHVNSTISKLNPDLDKRQRDVNNAENQRQELLATIQAADDGVFGDFCDRIGVENIREYEDVQLKIAKEASEAMEGFAAQQARIKHQVDFETTQLNNTRERLASLRSTISREERNIADLRSNLEDVQSALAELQAEIDRQRGQLDTANEAYEAVITRVEGARDTARRTQRTLDKAMKEIAAWNDEIVRSGSERHAIYRRCRLEEIDLPLIRGSLAKVPLELPTRDEDGMDIDESQGPAETEDYGIEPDFDNLEDDDKDNDSEEVGREFETQITKLTADLERVVPNMKAIDRLKDVEAGLEEAEDEAEETRRESKRAKDEFQSLKKRRCDMFNKAFTHMSENIDKIYKDLTKTTTQVGGTAWFTLEDAEEPYLSGVNYNTMPPGKRFAEMEQLSGGEKTMAALALLFAIHSYHPAPFFVLDEVDAALDATNVSKLARYVRNQADKEVQFLIISLKSTLYERADGLVGVYREQEENSSRTLTLDLRKYAT